MLKILEDKALEESFKKAFKDLKKFKLEILIKNSIKIAF